MIVNTPRIVPKGMNMHSIPAATMQKIRFLRFFNLLPARTMQTAILQPSTMNTDPMITNIQPKKGGGPELLLSSINFPETMASPINIANSVMTQ